MNLHTPSLAADRGIRRRPEDADHSLAVEFRAFIAERRFPCVGAKAVNRAGGLQILVARDFRRADDDRRIVTALAKLAADVRPAPQRFRSLAVLFENGAPESELAFEQRLWSRLQSLSDLDCHLGYPPDPRVTADPQEPHFAISFGGEAFFVVGIHPLSSRAARRFRAAGIIFNPHVQFERLRSDGRYSKMRSAIDARDRALSGSSNPMLAEHGTVSAARQYSGRAVGGDWRCPYRRSIG